MNIRLIGDHSKYHCGSAAAFRVIAAEAARNGVVTDPKRGEFDLLIVNGEGSMHHDNSGCRKKMAHIQAALSSGKRTMLINTVWQDNSDSLAEVLKDCERVVVREIMSQRALAAQGVNAEIAIDQSFHDMIDESAPYTDFRGRIVLTDFYSKDLAGFVKLNSKWSQEFAYIDMTAMSWSSLVRSLRTTSLLVTGRHHAVYAACKARLPFLALSSNTHKIEGLIQTAESKIPIFDRFPDLREHLEWPERHRAEYDALFDWMECQPPWRL